MRPEHSLPPDYFEAMFQGDADPWGLESRPYEAAKFKRTIEALEGRRYAQGFEVGCAGGVLTQQIAPHCDALLAIDVSETALARARKRCADQQQVCFERMMFPQTVPDLGTVDLMILSEVAYYWAEDDLERAGRWIGPHLASGGDLVLVHWTGDTDYPQTGDGAVEMLARILGSAVEVVTADRQPQYRLDVWRRT